MPFATTYVSESGVSALVYVSESGVSALVYVSESGVSALVYALKYRKRLDVKIDLRPNRLLF